MRKRELIDEIIKLQREHKTNKEIAHILKKHRNTISTYVNWLRKNQHFENIDILNRIDSRLNEELEQMTVKNLLAYRYQLVPRQFEGNMKEDITCISVSALFRDDLRENFTDDAAVIAERIKREQSKEIPDQAATDLPD